MTIGVTRALRIATLVVLSLAAGCATPYLDDPADESASMPGAPTRAPASPGPAAPTAAAQASPPRPSSPDHRQLANETHDFVVGNLLAPSGGYRTTAAENRTDEWHDVSQIGADVSMIALGDQRYEPYIDASYAFTSTLWDSAAPVGGYFATSKADGSGVDRSTKYVDDNSLAGVTWLDAYDTLGDANRRAAFLASARAVANFLMTGGVWDDVYGGGFYWSSAKPDKPTQSNGLALQLFLRLSSLTGETYYRDWATSVLSWLDGVMFDANDGLYSWKREAAGRRDAKFTYDQAILIDAHLLLYAQTKDAAHLARARALAEAMHRVLWDHVSGGYVISTEDRRLSPVFSAWASCTLVRLFEADADAKWLGRAAGNVAALDRRLRDSVTHGYFSGSRPDGSERTGDVQEVDQAWMQRAHAMLARH